MMGRTHEPPMSKQKQPGAALLVLIALTAVPTLLLASDSPGQILLGPNASPIEQYAARELQRYLYQVSGSLLTIETAKPERALSGLVFLLGTRDSNPLIARLAETGQVQTTAADPGPQGYVLKKAGQASRLTNPAGTLGRARRLTYDTLVIAGSDEAGCLYGVYGLLQDYYGIGFYLGGDVLPDHKTPLRLPDVDERKKPAVAIRGLLPWTNFPQSATSYSWQDWKFILDQMAKMRMNFLHIHNYNGEAGHNEMFHNVVCDGITPRVWMATARSGHAWGGRPGWDPNQYRFGASDLFDDYDFGADCARHNETLSNEAVFRKGVSEFQKVIAYAHTRGVKIGLGLDIDLLPPELKDKKADDPQLVAGRVGQIITDYPDLDYLLCFQSESIFADKARYKVWHNVFDGFYKAIKERAPQIRVAVAGWGISAEDVATLPPDVICAPISKYSAGCENGAIYGTREYWGCPWLERDGGSSEYYYPYNLNLSETIQAWQNRAPNLKGFYCLTWRLTDAIDPKMSYIAKVPWYDAGKYPSSEAVYREYAEQNYGPAAADAITRIIAQNEPFASDWGECMPTPPFAERNAAGGYLLNVSTFSVHPKDGKGEPLVAANSTEQHGTKNAPCSEGGLCVGFIEQGHWLRFDNVDFGAGADVFEARVASLSHGGEIELHLGSLEAPVLGVCAVENTGDWQKWVTRTAPISPTSGKHTLFMRFRGLDTSKAEFAKAEEQLKVIDGCIAAAPSPAQKARLQLLRCRIAAEKDHIELNQKFNHYAWADLPGAMESWAQNFVYRVTDISSLGNVVSSQNRFVQLDYVKKENELRKGLDVEPPSGVEARGTPKGAVIIWQAPGEIRRPKAEARKKAEIRGFNVYRDGTKLNDAVLPAAATSYIDKVNGQFRYNVTTVTADGRESRPSVPATCEAGIADRTPPHIVVISPPTSAMEGTPVWIEARVLDNRAHDCISATLHYRVPGSKRWKPITMSRRVKAVFTAQVPSRDVGASGLEYYVEASDGSNVALFPVSAPAEPLSLVTFSAGRASVPTSPDSLSAHDQTLSWTPSPGAFWYRIYRSDRSSVAPGPGTFLTYVAAGNTSFRDNGLDFAGRKLTGTCYYRVTAADKDDRESAPTRAVGVRWER
jgi:hypothetical protein